MSGYIASGRIVHVAPRVARGERTIAPDVDRLLASAAVLVETGSARVEPGRVAAHWSAARERFSQLTFYLFDPESWR